MLVACLVVGSVLGTACVVLLAALLLRPQKGPDEALASKVRALDTELENVYDQILAWRKRDHGRQKTEEPAPTGVPSNGRPATREELRARVIAMRNNG